MEFESPDVMKDFPGLYSTESGKKNNDSDYSDCDSNDKLSRKEGLLIGKRKEKKDRGYAALEGESSPEEDHQDTKSPSKTKKTKSFKFTSKSKEKDKKDKKVEKDKDDKDKKKDKENKKIGSKEKEKDKIKSDKKERKLKHVHDDKNNIEDILPVFGVTLEESVTRSRCHDGVDLPMPVRECIDHLESHGRSFENIYKLNGIKSKVLHIKKLYNQREHVNLDEYDVPTVTSVLKMFFRELPEAILTDALSQRFEEAGAIQNVSIREAKLLSLIEKLPIANRTILAWTILHLDHVTQNEKQTKMNAQTVAMTLSPVLQMSHRLLAALLCHCKALFKGTNLFRYNPPIMNSVDLPEECEAIEEELRKQESLLSQIHYEMNSGFVSKKREELLWEVQRMITQLKRKLRSIQKCTVNDTSKQVVREEHSGESSQMTKSLSCSDDSDTFQHKNNLDKSLKTQQQDESDTGMKMSSNQEAARLDNTSDSDTENLVNSNNQKNSDSENQDSLEQKLCFAETEVVDQQKIEPQPHINQVPKATVQTAAPPPNQNQHLHPTNSSSSPVQRLQDTTLLTLQHQNQLLNELKDTLVSQIAAEKSDVVYLKYCLANQQSQKPSDNSNQYITDMDKLEEVMDLLTKENRILKIKKTDLVREIMENREAVLALKTKLFISSVR